MNPVRWLADRIPPFRRDGGESDCLEGRQAPSWHECSRSGCESVRLSDVDPGVEAVVTCLEEPGEPRGRKLASLGLLPGVRLELLQRRPAYVVRIGYAELAIDHALASGVRVRADGDGDGR